MYSSLQTGLSPVEIEAGTIPADKTEVELLKQSNFSLKKFGIKDEDLFAASYNNLLIQPGNTTV